MKTTLVQNRFRSISLPARLHPISQVEALEKLKSWQVADIPGTSSSEAIQAGIVSLAHLYSSVLELTHQHGKTDIESSLSDSIELLDAGNIVRELFLDVRQSIWALHSALRRKKVTDSGVQDGVVAYFSCRKKTAKSAVRVLKSLRSLERRRFDGSNVAGSVLRETTGVAVRVFWSILRFLIPAPAGSLAAWNLVVKLVPADSGRKLIRDDAGNEIRNVDFGLRYLQGKMARNGNRERVCEQVRVVQERLREADDTIGRFEKGLERVSREMVQTRVALLNTLTTHI